MSEAKVNTVKWRECESSLHDIRFEVFIQEQNVSREDEWDGLDNIDGTVHFTVTTEGKTVGCARLLQNGQIGRMAILKQHRNKKLGATLLKYICQFALTQQFIDGDYSPLWLNAQLQALAFYETIGFRAEGEEFLEAGIPHKKMHFVLSADTLQKVYDNKVYRLTAPAQFTQHLDQIAQISRRSLDILSDNLDTTLWANSKLVDSISTFARDSRNSRVRILIKDSSNLAGLRHPLIELCKRLHSHMEIRILKDMELSVEDSFCIADGRQLVFFNSEIDYQGFANYAAPAECQHYKEEFERLWDHHGVHDDDLRVLVI